MKSTIGIFGIAALSLLFSVDASADRHRHGPPDGFYDYARVVDVEPIVEVARVSRPRQECWEEEVGYRYHEASYRQESYTPVIVGGILGGVVGNQFGKGRGRKILTVAGTVLGASIARDLTHQAGFTHRPHRQPVYEQRCRVVEDYYPEERVKGYRVVYRYRGETLVTRLNHRPGRKIRVRVTVQPEYHGHHGRYGHPGRRKARAYSVRCADEAYL